MSLMPSSLQEHPERLPGAGGCVGAEPRTAAQVHHAGHRHHAQAGEALPLGTCTTTYGGCRVSTSGISHLRLSGTTGGDSGQKPPSQGPDAPGGTAVSPSSWTLTAPSSISGSPLKIRHHCSWDTQRAPSLTCPPTALVSTLPPNTVHSR